MSLRILVIDDETPIRRLLRITLAAEGYHVLEAATGADGLLACSTQVPDAVVLDLGLPDVSGEVVLERLREWSPVPVLVLSVRDDEAGKVRALDGGADDYVTKPFLMGELLARLRVILRRRRDDAAEPIIVFGAIALDRANRRVSRGDESIRLTPIEYNLLAKLAANLGRVLTHRQLLRDVWGSAQYEDAGHYLRVYVAHLRKKLEDDPARPRLLLTEPGVGYRLVDPDN